MHSTMNTWWKVLLWGSISASNDKHHRKSQRNSLKFAAEKKISMSNAAPASNIFAQIKDFDHEQLVFNHDPKSGLKSIIAIHNTVLGPALGGTRMWAYKSEGDAVQDVIRLSRGMTFKAAISGLNLGGGKAVIIGDPFKDKSEALWRRYGQFVDALSGNYITAEDVGTTTDDMEYVSMETEYCAGKPKYLGGGGDPSPVTAYGTYLGMKAAANKSWGNDSLSGKKILVQGVGHVGQYLVDYLVKENAKIFIADINEKNIEQTVKKHKVTIVPADKVYEQDVDIYAPCALGATLNDKTIPMLKCEIIAGAANNQLKDEVRHGEMIKKKNLRYAPDFLINAGGLINCYSELHGYNRELAFGYTEKIYQRAIDIFEMADRQKLTTQEAAKKQAMERIDAMTHVNSRY